MAMDRRAFLQLLTAGAASAAFPTSIARALDIPARAGKGTIDDVEHVVFLMQENRSFDHYFGVMRGVRGYGDPRAVRLRNGHSVWNQPKRSGGSVMPFRPPAPESSDAGLGLTFLEDLAHDWTTTHEAWNRGQYDQWIPAKGPVTMAHLTRDDIPFHYALADAFTVCDAYYCSLLGPTGPNRYHMWTGWVGNDGKDGGPKVDNDGTGFTWGTYPERLHKAGISCKVYQDTGLGLDPAGNWGETQDAYIGNYGDNSLLDFLSYEQAEEDSPLARIAKTGTEVIKDGSLFEVFAADVKAGRLPQVSWVVAPEAYSEHPNWPANYGAWYISQVLDALTAKPEVWSKTVLFVMYDENDGFFDHMVPPTPPGSSRHGAMSGLSTVSTKNEIFPGDDKYPAGPYGLGVRVPMIVVSPWSRGGWVNSEVFDHTSMIRFLERRFGVHEPNITPWRRAVTGDLTSALDFSRRDDASVPLPGTVSYRPTDRDRHQDFRPNPPREQGLPQQETGPRPARPLPYALEVDAQVDGAARSVAFTLRNTGTAAAVFHLRVDEGGEEPRSYTVEAGRTVADTLVTHEKAYGYSIYGPNGFYRQLQGNFATTDPVITGSYDTATGTDGKPVGVMRLTLRNPSSSATTIVIRNGYRDETRRVSLEPGQSMDHTWTMEDSQNWYDLQATTSDSAYLRHFAGHVETGRESTSDPAMGKSSFS